MPKFKKKPVIVEAVQITRPMTIETLEVVMRGEPGDWLIIGVKGERYFCKDDIFRQTYEPYKPVEEEVHNGNRDRKSSACRRAKRE